MSWRKDIHEDPIPPEALKAALAHLVDKLGLPGHNNRGQKWLAETIGVSVYTVHRWTSGKSRCMRFAADAVRKAILEAI